MIKNMVIWTAVVESIHLHIEERLFFFTGFLSFSLSDWSRLSCLESCTVSGCLFSRSWRLKVHDVIHMDVENPMLFKTIIPLYWLPFLLLINLKWTFMPNMEPCSVCGCLFASDWRLRFHEVIHIDVGDRLLIKIVWCFNPQLEVTLNDVVEVHSVPELNFQKFRD